MAAMQQITTCARATQSVEDLLYADANHPFLGSQNPLIVPKRKRCFTEGSRWWQSTPFLFNSVDFKAFVGLEDL
jgi:hypothetical protein